MLLGSDDKTHGSNFLNSILSNAVRILTRILIPSSDKCGTRKLEKLSEQSIFIYVSMT